MLDSSHNIEVKIRENMNSYVVAFTCGFVCWFRSFKAVTCDDWS